MYGSHVIYVLRPDFTFDLSHPNVLLRAKRLGFWRKRPLYIQPFVISFACKTFGPNLLHFPDVLHCKTFCAISFARPNVLHKRLVPMVIKRADARARPTLQRPGATPAASGVQKVKGADAKGKFKGPHWSPVEILVGGANLNRPMHPSGCFPCAGHGHTLMAQCVSPPVLRQLPTPVCTSTNAIRPRRRHSVRSKQTRPSQGCWINSVPQASTSSL